MKEETLNLMVSLNTLTAHKFPDKNDDIHNA